MVFAALCCKSRRTCPGARPDTVKHLVGVAKSQNRMCLSVLPVMRYEFPLVLMRPMIARTEGVSSAELPNIVAAWAA